MAKVPVAKNLVPRCPLCGIVLDMDIKVTDLEAGSGLLTITARSLAHVAEPHSLTVKQ